MIPLLYTILFRDSLLLSYDSLCIYLQTLLCPKVQEVKQGEATPTAGGRKADLEERQDPQDLMNMFQKLCPNGC